MNQARYVTTINRFAFLYEEFLEVSVTILYQQKVIPAAKRIFCFNLDPNG
jgi:hypothetical protein